MADHFSRQARQGWAVAKDGATGASGVDSATEGELFAVFEREWVDHHFRLAVRRYRTEADVRAVAILEGTLAGKSARQIADERSMTDSAVHKAQHRLRDRLRALIAGQLRDEEDVAGHPL